MRFLPHSVHVRGCSISRLAYMPHALRSYIRLFKHSLVQATAPCGRSIVTAKRVLARVLWHSPIASILGDCPVCCDSYGSNSISLWRTTSSSSRAIKRDYREAHPSEVQRSPVVRLPRLLHKLSAVKQERGEERYMKDEPRTNPRCAVVAERVVDKELGSGVCRKCASGSNAASGARRTNHVL